MKFHTEKKAAAFKKKMIKPRGREREREREKNQAKRNNNNKIRVLIDDWQI